MRGRYLETSISLGLVAVIAIVLIVLMPAAIIWSINALFGTAIVLNIKTWASVLVLFVLFGR